MPRTTTAFALSLLLCLTLSACLMRVREVRVDPVVWEETPTGTHVGSPVRAHLLDGSTVVYTNGVVFGPDVLHGTGTRYDLRLEPRGRRA